MLLTLKREVFTANSTIGRLSVDGKFNCFTLEDVVRKGAKIYSKTAIPAGRYQITINHSPRFKRLLPLLLNVPGFEGIRIHSGNTADDTEGCILVGRTRSRDFIGESRLAFAPLFNQIEEALTRRERVFIEIS